MESHHISLRSRTSKGLFFPETSSAYLDILQYDLRLAASSRKKRRLCHRRSGISPCPEDTPIISKKPCNCKAFNSILLLFSQLFQFICFISMHKFQTSKMLLTKSFVDNHTDGIGNIQTSYMFIIHRNTQGFFRMTAHKILW